MDSNHRYLGVGQGSLPLDHGTDAVTEVGIEPTICHQTLDLAAFADLRTRPSGTFIGLANAACAIPATLTNRATTRTPAVCSRIVAPADHLRQKPHAMNFLRLNSPRDYDLMTFAS